MSYRRHIGYFVILAFLLASALPSVHVRAASEEYTSYPSVNPVKIDGKFTAPNEWNDTTQEPLYSGTLGILGYFASKYDSGFIYFMWDVVLDSRIFLGNSSINPDQVGIYLDTLNDKTDQPKTDDYRVFVMHYSGITVDESVGTPSGWSSTSRSRTLVGASSMTVSPNSDKSHLVYELRMPTSFGGIKSHMHDGGIGFATFILDGNKDAWGDLPSNFYYLQPQTWGTLQFSSVVVPEFFSSESAFVLSLVLLLVAVVYRRRFKRQELTSSSGALLGEHT